jgi:RHS repeat-associated protein
MHNDENRLIQWFHYNTNSVSPASGDLRTDFVYDGIGQLRKRLEYVLSCPDPGHTNETGPQLDYPQPGDCVWNGITETDYIYDGWRVIQERDGSNTPTVSYTRGNDLSGSLQGAGGIGGLLGRSSGYSSGNWTTHNYYFADGNGNVTYMLNSSQTMVASYRYDPFGNTISSSGNLASANVYRFSSKEIHANSGMYYYGFRFYDPNLQRWINRDPVRERGGLNLYGYVYNDAANFVDPYGLSLQDDLECARKAYEAAKLAAQKAVEFLNSSTDPAEKALGQEELTDMLDKLTRARERMKEIQELIRLRNLGGFATSEMILSTVAVAASGVAGYAGGRALGNSTPYPGGGTIDQNVQDAICVPFWNWWYGSKQ